MSYYSLKTAVVTYVTYNSSLAYYFCQKQNNMGFFQELKEQIFGTPVDYRALIENGAVVVDVRSPQEFKSGHAKGSKNIPLQNLNGKVKQLKSKEVIVVCKSGMRAGQAKSTLTSNGITCHNAGAWQRVNF